MSRRAAGECGVLVVLRRQPMRMVSTPMLFAGLARATDGDESSEQRNIIRPRLRCSWAVKSMEPRPDGAKAAGLAVAAPIFMAGAVKPFTYPPHFVPESEDGCTVVDVDMLHESFPSARSSFFSTLEAQCPSRKPRWSPTQQQGSYFSDLLLFRKLSPAARAPNSRSREHGLLPAHDNDLESAYQEPLDVSSSPLQRQLLLPVCLPLCTLSFSPTVA